MVKLVGLSHRLNVSKCFVCSPFSAGSFIIYLGTHPSLALQACVLVSMWVPWAKVYWTPFVVMVGTWILSACVLCMRNAQLGTCAPAKEVFMTTLRTVCSAHMNKMQLRWCDVTWRRCSLWPLSCSLTSCLSCPGPKDRGQLTSPALYCSYIGKNTSDKCFWGNIFRHS